MITTEGIGHWSLGTNQNLLHFSLVLRSRLENKQVEDNKLACPVVGKFFVYPHQLNSFSCVESCKNNRPCCCLLSRLFLPNFLNKKACLPPADELKEPRIT